MACTDTVPAVCVRELRRSYSPARTWRGRGEPIEALRGLDLDIARGEIHGLLGPNGAGKTTLCRILATVLLPSSGSVQVLGYDVIRQATSVRRSIGVVFGGDKGLYPRLTGRQNLRFWAALHGLSPAEGRAVSKRLLQRVGLSERADERVEGYSRGMRQRLHLARGIVGDPALVLLDEPTSGMDPVAAIEFRTFVTELRDEGRTLLLATHNMAEAEQLCDRVTLIDQGCALASGSPQRLMLDAGVVSLRTMPIDLEQAYLALVGDRGLGVAR
jgi:ABC-2 type transport system ATP-binding protein